jgi:hypothetical protein
MARNDTTRRGFLGALGAVAALPLFPALATHASPSGRWADAMTGHGESLRALYLAELARFAESLRPRFQAGELRAYREDDHGSPQWEVERLAAAHFGVKVTERTLANGDTLYLGDEVRARLILAASPRTGVTGEGETVVCNHAREAVGWDVIGYARERGWYTPTADETQDPLLEHETCPACAAERFHHAHDDMVSGRPTRGDESEAPGECPVRYTKHVPGVQVA